ncbi:hypothetical protein Hanom_Chr09g00820621 [Helianthus anomalus]
MSKNHDRIRVVKPTGYTIAAHASTHVERTNHVTLVKKIIQFTTHHLLLTGSATLKN